MGIHISKKQSQVGKTLPFISRHPIQQGLFTIDHFIMGEWQHKILRKGIGCTKGQIVLMVFPINRFFFKIFQGIVHPSHHPFHTKTKASHTHWFRYH